MASSDKKKKSTSSQPNTAALVTVVGSELDFYTNSNYLAYELPQFAAAQRQGKLGNDGKEWRSHMDQTKKYHESVKGNLPDVRFK